jgi:hypothetical protein
MTSCQKNVLPSGYEDKKITLPVIATFIIEVRKQMMEALSVIGREILQLCQGAFDY